MYVPVLNIVPDIYLYFTSLKYCLQWSMPFVHLWSDSWTFSSEFTCCRSVLCLRVDGCDIKISKSHDSWNSYTGNVEQIIASTERTSRSTLCLMYWMYPWDSSYHKTTENRDFSFIPWATCTALFEKHDHLCQGRILWRQSQFWCLNSSWWTCRCSHTHPQNLSLGSPVFVVLLWRCK